MFGFIKRLFGIGGGGAYAPPAPTGTEEDLVHVVKYTLSEIVDHPGDLQVTKTSTEQLLELRIRCHQEDKGKVIGKSGQTIKSLRAIIVSAAGRNGRQIAVELDE